MKSNRWLWCFVLLTSPAFAQLELSQRPMAQLVDIGETETIDDVVLVQSGSVIRTVPVIIVEAKTEAANVQVDASDVTRTPVEFRTLSGGRYLFTKPGKTWVDVTAIDFAANIYSKKTIVVEVGPSPTPPGPQPPGPGPVPPNPPAPDNGAFDGLAAKVAVHARQLDATPRNQIAGILSTAADKMRAFEFRQAQQAVDYIARNWPPCESPHCGAIYKLVSEDSKNRQLSWQETQEYYRTVAKGMLQ